MGRDAAGDTWDRLRNADDEVEVLDPDSLGALPGPARRLLGRVLPHECPLTTAVELGMAGQLRLGGRWWPFRAAQLLRPGVGFVWRATVGGRLVRFEGADLLGPDGARMDFRLWGLVPVVQATGPDVERSAAGRLAAETVAWLPQALTPQAGARWTPGDDRRAVVTLGVGGEEVDVEVSVEDDGRLSSLSLSRWNGSASPPGPEPFGGRFGSELTTPEGVRLAGSGSVGWGWGTPGWTEGEFFRFRLESAASPS